MYFVLALIIISWKPVVVPENVDFSDEEIRNLTNFQEKYFESEIIR